MSNVLLERVVLHEGFDLDAAILATKERGYYFADHALSELARTALCTELASLPLAYADHVSRPIQPQSPLQVRQQHERFYTAYTDRTTPAANLVIGALSVLVRSGAHGKELIDWLPNEIGYQRYHNLSGFIDPHRDRVSDRRLSVTFTLNGSADVNVFEAIDNAQGYSLQNLRQTDAFVTSPGSIMLLRAPGFGTGEQTIHQVLPPTDGERTIINLRDRPTVLEQPDHPRWQ